MVRPFIDVFNLDEGQGLRQTAMAAVEEGYAVIPVAPGGKVPLCTLTRPERRRLEKEGLRHDCGTNHAITDKAEASRIFTRLTKEHGALNIGVVAGPSHLLIVDTDTTSQTNAFLNDWAEATDEPAILAVTPTVRTPGKLVGDSWVHKDGGHFYFDLPPGLEIPWDQISTLVAPGGYLVKWGNSQVVAPPSVRSEGRYVANADVGDAPEFLVALVMAGIDQVTAYRTRPRDFFPNDTISDWSMATPWSDLLTRHDWTSNDKPESCGCMTWTKPGGGTTSDKSAVAHEAGCSFSEMAEGHGALHLWTDDPPQPLVPFIEASQHHVTKLQFVAAMEYQGDIEDAKVGLGLGPDLVAWMDDLEEVESRPESGSPAVVDQGTVTPSERPVPSNSPSKEKVLGTGPQEEAQAPGTEEVDEETGPDESQSPPVTRDSFFRETEPPEVRKKIKQKAADEIIRRRAVEYVDHRTLGPSLRMTVQSAATITPSLLKPEVACRNDGVPILYRGRVNSVWGPSEVGKSWFTLACTRSVLEAGGKVLIIDTEDDETGLWSRLDQLGLVSDQILYVRLWAKPDSLERDEIAAVARGVDLVVVDSFDGLLALYEADSNLSTSVRVAGAMMKLWARAGNAALLVVDHSTEKAQGQVSHTAMGSSAKKQQIDGVMLRADKETRWEPNMACSTMIMVGKDRHGGARQMAEFDPQARGEDANWGRVARLSMTPVLGEEGRSCEIALEKPPSYADEPAKGDADAKVVMEDRIMSYLMKKPGVWHFRTEVLQAAGDKNDRNGEGRALDGLVKTGMVEEQQKTSRLRQYRMPDLDAQDSAGAGSDD